MQGNENNRKKPLISPAGRWLVAMAALLLLAVPAGAAVNVGDELDAIRGKVDDLVDSLAGKNSLTKSEVTELRRQLNRVSRDLDDLRDQVGSGSSGGGGGQLGRDWALYTMADVDVYPSWAKFERWDADRKIATQKESDGIELQIDNAGYSADWEIDMTFSGNPQIAVDPMASGDVYVTVRDNRGLREFLIRNGGLGPIYLRENAPTPGKGTNPPPANSSMAWAAGYEDLVAAGQLSRSTGMDWFIDQVARDQYASRSLAPLGRHLRNNLPEQVQGEIAILKYTELFQTKRISITDPRNSVTSFVYAMDKAYNMYQQGINFSIEMKQ